MTQPSFVPIAEPDQVRPALRLEPPRRWVAGRPAEVVVPRRSGGPMGGASGPDQGYALLLARRATPRLALADGEQAADVELGVALLAARRAALFGRAPSAPDIRAIVALWGLVTDDPPEGLVDERRRAFQGVSHDYARQRALVGRVPEETLHLSPEQIEGRVAAGDWRELVGVGPGEVPSTEGPTASPGEPAATG
jgi:hypothetical protein